ncbi:MAG: hypothetical protein DRN96_05295 [Thermoproteota archaeon]|nr:MAG: hypothetical protein DRN96_05295 [Candidatus Korarchaeota archaeon]
MCSGGSLSLASVEAQLKEINKKLDVLISLMKYLVELLTEGEGYERYDEEFEEAASPDYHTPTPEDSIYRYMSRARAC